MQTIDLRQEQVSSRATTATKPQTGGRASPRAKNLALCLILAATLAPGCARVDWPSLRQDNASQFLEESEQAATEALPEDTPLTLDDCLQLAMEHSIPIKTARIEARIADLERRVAFANFLPTLDLNWTHVSWDRQPENKMLGFLSTPLHDRSMRDTALEMQLPVFVPATWFLYRMHRRGSDIAELVETYTRQMVALQVTAMYYHALAVEESAVSLESQMRAAEVLQREVTAYREEGLVTPSQTLEVETRVLARQTALSQTQRAKEAALSDLLAAMGLSPLADVALAPALPLAAPEDNLDELVWKALMNNPQLRIADHAVAIQEDRVRIAITEFLPKLVGFASRTSATNSFVTYPDFTISGLSAMFSVFNGFANINEYRAAKEEKRRAYLEREEACFSLLTAVVRAQLNLQDAQSGLALAEKALQLAKAQLREAEAQWQEGLLNPSQRLATQARRDAAEMQVAQAQFGGQVATAALLNVLGEGHTGIPEVQNDAT